MPLFCRIVDTPGDPVEGPDNEKQKCVVYDDGDDDMSDADEMPDEYSEDSESSEEDYLQGRTREQYAEDWAKYPKQIKESKGFDVDCYPGDSLRATFLPRTMFLRCPQFKNRMMKMAQEALKYFNDGHNYEAVDVEKAVGTIALFYFITFKTKKSHAASNANADDDEKIFQAVVSDIGKIMTVKLCRIKPTN